MTPWIGEIGMTEQERRAGTRPTWGDGAAMVGKSVRSGNDDAARSRGPDGVVERSGRQLALREVRISSTRP